MEFSRELLFFFSALGAFNGLIMGLYFLFFAKPKSIGNFFLGILLFTLSVRIGKSVFFYFNPHLSEIFLQIGVSAVAFVGPSLYFYLLATTRSEPLKGWWKIHYLVILVALSIVGAIYPWELYPERWYLIFDLIYYEWLAYLLVSGIVIRDLLSKFLKAPKELNSLEIWILSIYLGNVLVWVAYNTLTYTSYIVGALSFSFIFYLLALLLFFTRKKDPSFLGRQMKYGNKKIDEKEADELYSQLDQLMRNESLFNNPNLKLPDVARKLNILPHRLSQLINDNLEKNFTLFLNEYRIEEAKKLIRRDAHLKLESIGYACGFNSKSTFYSTFRKITGTTPAKFKEQVENL